MATQTKVTATDFKPPITVEQWGELEGPPHYELVDGQLKERPPAAFWHEVLLLNMLDFMRPYAKQRHSGMFVGSRAKLRISAFQGREPDIFFIPAHLYQLIGRNLFTGVPTLAVEILSPFNEQEDRVAKRLEYARLGILQYWIVDFANRRIEVYELRKSTEGTHEYELVENVLGDAIFRPSLFPGQEIPLAEVWPTEFEDRLDDS
jgi:Uma2 family endonuclease